MHVNRLTESTHSQYHTRESMTATEHDLWCLCAESVHCQITNTINKSLKDKNAASIKAECGEGCCCDCKGLHVHNVKLERREGNKEERDTGDAFHIKSG